MTSLRTDRIAIEQHESSFLWVIGVGSFAVALAISFERLPHLSLSWAAFGFAILIVERARIASGSGIHWWLTEAPVLSWAALVLVPWTVRRNEPFLTVGLEGFVPKDLPLTWAVNLMALGGIAATCVILMPKTPVLHRRSRFAVSGSRAVLGVVVILALYLIGYSLTGRPLGSIWRLGGSYTYAEPIGTGPAFFDLLPIVMTVYALSLTAVRRSIRRTLPASEVIVILVTGFVVLALGGRFRLVLLILGFVTLQWCWPAIRRQHATARPRRIIASATGVLGSIWLVGLIGRVRSGPAGAQTGSISDYVRRSLDVVSTAEMLRQRGLTAGLLGGGSYTQLPALFVPRSVAGAAKQYPLAQQLVDNTLSAGAGFSAPVWFEGYLNYGLIGVVAVVVSITTGMFVVLRVTYRRSSRLSTVITLVSPILPLLVYGLFSRLLMFQTLITCLAIAAGIVAATIACCAPLSAGSPAMTADVAEDALH